MESLPKVDVTVNAAEGEHEKMEVLKVCQALVDDWKEFNPEQITVVRFTGGVTNRRKSHSDLSLSMFDLCKQITLIYHRL